MMDVSDGLVLDSTRMADASATTIAFESSALGLDLERALTGGEDHGLLATFPPSVPLPTGFRRIGAVEERSTDAVTVDGEPFTRRGGWDPYLDWDAGRG